MNGRNIFSGIIFILCCTMLCACATPKEGKPAETGPAVCIMNASTLPGEHFDALYKFCARELEVRTIKETRKPLRAGNTEKLIGEINATRPADAGCMIVLTDSISGTDAHLTVSTNRMTALIQLEPLQCDDAQTFEWRAARQVMRAAAFLYGMQPTPDPYCVTRPYRTADELDRLGRNFSPPLKWMLKKEMIKRGIAPAPRPEIPAELRKKTGPSAP